MIEVKNTKPYLHMSEVVGVFLEELLRSHSIISRIMIQAINWWLRMNKKNFFFPDKIECRVKSLHVKKNLISLQLETLNEKKVLPFSSSFYSLLQIYSKPSLLSFLQEAFPFHNIMDIDLKI